MSDNTVRSAFPPRAAPRLRHLVTPDRCVLLLLGVLGLLRLCDWYSCFGMYEHRGVLMLTALATVGAFLVLRALVSRRTAVAPAVPVRHTIFVPPSLGGWASFGWLEAEMRTAKERREAIEAVFQRYPGDIMYDYQFDKSRNFIGGAKPRAQPGCGQPSAQVLEGVTS